LDSAVAIDRNVEKVEKVTIHWATASSQETHALHWQLGRDIARCPMRAAVEGVRDVKVPDACKRVSVGITGTGDSTVKGHCRPADITSHSRWKGDIL
jgi:hypothetical protein